MNLLVALLTYEVKAQHFGQLYCVLFFCFFFFVWIIAGQAVQTIGQVSSRHVDL